MLIMMAATATTAMGKAQSSQQKMQEALSSRQDEPLESKAYRTVDSVSCDKPGHTLFPDLLKRLSCSHFRVSWVVFLYALSNLLIYLIN